ncbi:MAG TPA: FkbM family methyltransferase [Acidimicrobiales bacterium]|nr:FkbM family methyltransferase [Acidimicrobiales bacterium]
MNDRTPDDDGSARGTRGGLAARLRDPALTRMALCAVLPPSTPLRRRLRHDIVFVGPNRPGWGGRGVFVFGDALEPELAVLDRLVSPGDVVLDVGANSGIYTLTAAKLVGPSGLVVSLEPNPQMLEVLDRNVRRNGLDNVRIRGLAASDHCGEVAFFENDAKPNSFSIVPRHGTLDSFSVLSVDLDTLAGWEGLERVDFIKMDVEGAEDKAVAGAAGLIARHRPAILAEVFHGGLTAVPEGYVVYQAPTASPNQLLVPVGHRLEAVVRELDWHEAHLPDHRAG